MSCQFNKGICLDEISNIVSGYFRFTETINLQSADYGFRCNKTPRKDGFKVGGF